MPPSVDRVLRLGWDCIRYALTATLGTAIAETSVWGIYHPKTFAAACAKEIIISGILASLLGALSQYIRPSNVTRWIWLLGIVTFAATFRIQPTSVFEEAGSFKLELPLDVNHPNEMTLVFVSVRLVAYSLGAFCYDSLTRSRISPEPPTPNPQVV